MRLSPGDARSMLAWMPRPHVMHDAARAAALPRPAVA
jgi:hypothetical protein